MSYGKEQIKTLMYKLRQILNLLSDELPQYWWLSQGEAPVVAVRILTLRDGKLVVKESPKLGLKAAVLTIIKNLDVIQKLKGGDFRLAIKVIEEDIGAITKIYSLIKEAHELVKKAETLKTLVNASGLPNGEKIGISEDLDKLIFSIRDIMLNNPYEFSAYKGALNKLLEKIEEKIGNQ